MFNVTDFSQASQRAISLLMAAVIVAAMLGVAAWVAESGRDSGYSVSITQL